MAKTAEKQMNKMEAVRRGLEDLGNEAKPSQLQPHIKEKYAIEMGTDHISTYKGVILRKGKTASNGRKASKVAAKPSVNTMHESWAADNHATKPTRQATTSLADQVAMLKSVCGVIGKGEAKKIIDLL